MAVSAVNEHFKRLRELAEIIFRFFCGAGASGQAFRCSAKEREK